MQSRHYVEQIKKKRNIKLKRQPLLPSVRNSKGNNNTNNYHNTINTIELKDLNKKETNHNSMEQNNKQL